MKRYFKIFKIKLNLLRISLFKNLTTLVTVFLIIIIGLVIGGVITEDTPLLGWLFGGLADVFKSMWEDLKCGNVITGVTPVITSLASIYILITRFKAIGLSDIKSNKTKIDIIRNGMILNSHGFLVKKDKHKRKNKQDDISDNLITNTVRSISEIGSIITSKVDTETSDEEILNKASEEVVTEEGLQEIVNPWYHRVLNKCKDFCKLLLNVLKDFIGIFKREENKEIEKEIDEYKNNIIKQEIKDSTENDINTNNTVEINIKQNNIIPVVEEIKTETINIEEETSDLIKNEYENIGEQILDASKKQDQVVKEIINDTQEIVNNVKVIKNEYNNTKNDKEQVNKKSSLKNSPSNLLAKLNSKK